MPHDVNGKPLSVGDEVIIRGKVTTLTGQDEYCNCAVETLEKLYPNDTPSTFFALNTRQVELVEKPVEQPAPEAAPGGEAPAGQSQPEQAGSEIAQ